MNSKAILKYAALVLASASVMAGVMSLYAMGFGSMRNVTADDAPDFAESVSASDAFNVGDRGGDVWLIQKKLNELGYYTGEASGVYDRETAEAVRRFQLDEGLYADGRADHAELDALGIYSDPSEYVLKLGSSGSDVMRLQRTLRRLGYYNGAVTGSYGSQTAEAVRSYRSEHGLPIKSEADAQLLEHLGLKAGNSAADSSSDPYDNGTSYRKQLLARLVETVASDEPYSAQTAVASAALNREREADGELPLRTVVTLLLNEYGRDLTLANTCSERAISAARDAMFGIDPTSGASHFGSTPEDERAVKLGSIWFY